MQTKENTIVKISWRVDWECGHWDVITKPPYPNRIGHISGGRKHYTAEVGPIIVGFYTTKNQAHTAILDYNNKQIKAYRDALT